MNPLLLNLLLLNLLLLNLLLLNLLAESTPAESTPTEESSGTEVTSAPEESATSDVSSTVDATSDEPSVTSDEVTSETPSEVACFLNGEQISVVDYATGVCDFEIPDYLETFFNFVSSQDYNIQYYYARVSGNQYTNDIRSAGRIVSIPARVLFELHTKLFQVHLQEGSTRRDDVDDFIDSIIDTDGTETDVDLSAGIPVDEVASSSAAESTQLNPLLLNPSC